MLALLALLALLGSSLGHVAASIATDLSNCGWRKNRLTVRGIDRYRSQLHALPSTTLA